MPSGHVVLFVGQLSFSATAEHVKELFDFYGDVKKAEVICDKKEDRSTGSAFVHYDSTEEADCAISALHGRFNMGRNKPLQVSYHAKSSLWSQYGLEHAFRLHNENKSNPLPPSLQ